MPKMVRPLYEFLDAGRFRLPDTSAPVQTDDEVIAGARRRNVHQPHALLFFSFSLPDGQPGVVRRLKGHISRTHLYLDPPAYAIVQHGIESGPPSGVQPGQDHDRKL